MDALQFLGLPSDSQPNPESNPIPFLFQNVRSLPANILLKFSESTTPKERTVIPVIRNRRFKFSESNPRELRFESAITTWPELWKGPVLRGQAEGNDEKKWAEQEFMGGKIKQHVGKLGRLLGDYEEEREAERFRIQRRQQAAVEPFVPEEDADSDDEDLPPAQEEEPESEQQSQVTFERLVKEKFIYGLLEVLSISAVLVILDLITAIQSDLYDQVDWDDVWDGEIDREAEDRWFDEEDEDEDEMMQM
jgi:hypothetical protein